MDFSDNGKNHKSHQNSTTTQNNNNSKEGFCSSERKEEEWDDEKNPLPQKNETYLENKENMDEISKKNLGVFIEKIIDGKKEPLSQLLAVLEARGFIVSKRGNDFYIFDLSAKYRDVDMGITDLPYIEEIFKRNNIGYLLDRKIVLNSDFKTEQLMDFFLPPHGGFGAGGDRISLPLGWRDFYERKRGIVIPLSDLDPLISRLVRAISLINISTDYSCAGRGFFKSRRPRWPHIHFSNYYDALWFKTIFNNLVNPAVIPRSDWKITHGKLIIKNSHEDIVEMYWEIQKVALFLTKRQQGLLELKKCVVKKLNHDENFLKMIYDIKSDKNSSHLYENKIFEFFHTQYNQCLPEKLDLNVGE